MSKIFDVAGDVVDETVDFVDENKEILAAIALAYATSGASVPATATAEATAAATAAELTAAEIAAAEAAKQAALTESARVAAQNAAIAEGTYSQVAADSALKVAADAKAATIPPSLNASNPFQSAFFGDIQGASPAAIAEGASTIGIPSQGYFGVGGKFAPLEGTAADFAKTLVPKTPGEYFTTALTLSAGGNVINALNPPEQQQARPRSTTNTYEGPQAPKTYVTQPAELPLSTRYDAAKQQVSKTVGTPTNVGLLAVNNSPFYNFLKTNNLNRGIL